MNKKTNYITVADLLTDEGFLSWYLATDESCEQFWAHWIAASPEHAKLAAKAVQMLKIITSPVVEKPDYQQLDAAFERLRRKILELEKMHFVTKN